MYHDFSNVPQDADEWAQWHFLHNLEHDRLLGRIADTGKPVDHYPLGEMITPDYLQMHDEQHRALRDRLGITDTPDIAEVDIHDREALNNWITAHFIEHIRMNMLLPA